MPPFSTIQVWYFISTTGAKIFAPLPYFVQIYRQAYVERDARRQW